MSSTNSSKDCTIYVGGVFDPLGALYGCDCGGCRDRKIAAAAERAESKARATDQAAIIAAERAERIACRRCCGRGRMAEFKHVSGGVCFECSGSGTTTKEGI